MKSLIALLLSATTCFGAQVTSAMFDTNFFKVTSTSIKLQTNNTIAGAAASIPNANPNFTSITVGSEVVTGAVAGQWWFSNAPGSDITAAIGNTNIYKTALDLEGPLATTNNEGTVGQALVSAGAGNPPFWGTPSVSASVWIHETIGSQGLLALSSGTTHGPIRGTVGSGFGGVGGSRDTLFNCFGGYLTNLIVMAGSAGSWNPTTNIAWLVATNILSTSGNCVGTSLSVTQLNGYMYTNSGTASWTCPTGPAAGGWIWDIEVVVSGGQNLASGAYSWSVEWWHLSP